jgi:hypothetical protein
MSRSLRMHEKAKTFQVGATLLVVFMIGGGTIYAYAVNPALPGQRPPSLSRLQAGQSGGICPAAVSNGSHSLTQSQTSSNSTGSSESQNGPAPSDGERTSTTATSRSTQSNGISSSGRTSTGGDSGSETSTRTRDTNSSSGEGSQQGLQFRMVSVLSQLPVAGYQTGAGQATIDLTGTTIVARVELSRMNPRTSFELALVVNGTYFSLGNFSSSEEGEAEIQAQYSVNPGSYSVGLAVFDLSTLHTKLLGMASQPATLTLTVAQSQSSSSATTQSQQTESVTVVTGGRQEQDDIEKAIGDKTIPAVIQVGSGGIGYTVIDSNFTLFVGSLQGGGIQITISATNVSQPRVLLVNLNSSQYLNLQSGSLTISYDGTPVSQAGSVAQVLNPQPTVPPMFVLVSASAGYQLLISIPHFSTHFIQILPALEGLVRNLFAVDGTALILSLAVVTGVMVTVYSRRTRLLT